ncbi:DISARM system phospholipase D-like protein DrmC [Streptomyces sp. NPDC048277]|uniref:DISARM system phospholipase D-like protein DrmC n=1 Tax=Streptomyces sp. NPDC048277 TaxID=3155027 RepID=UPI0033C38DB5
MTDRLPRLLAELGRRIPPEQLSVWTEVLRSARAPSADLTRRIIQVLPAAGVSIQAEALGEVWKAESPTTPGYALALALETAAEQYEQCRSERETQLVVSGPVSPAVPTRLTSSVVIDVIQAAEEALLVVSFAAYGVVEVVRELRTAARRGVRIDLLLEQNTSAADAFASLAGDVHIWRRPSAAGSGRLHAKLIAADRHTAVVGSANLTDRGLTDNIEVGVALRDGVLVGRLVDHFRSLMDPVLGPLYPD